MSVPQLHRVRSRAMLVALAATGIVAAVYVVIAAFVVLVVEHNLTSAIDTRLASSLSRITREPYRLQTLPTTRELPGFPRFGPPLLVWIVSPDGSVNSIVNSAGLPSGDRYLTSPQTISVGGTDVRIAGTAMGGSRLLVAQSMDGVAQARLNVLRAEVIVGPILLAAVFLGALTIGRRVAAPIEVARQRQMEFTADASHELRTPLSVIEAQTGLALAQEHDPEWNRRAFRRIDVESKRIRHLVEDMLWLARFDATQAQPNAEPIDMGVLAAQAADRFGTVAEARRLQLRVRPGSGSLVVLAPPEWLDRLLGVLLDNACKYSPEGGSVEVAVRAEGNRVRLAVEDSGPGIPPEERTRIFDRFHRATDTPGGAGLGLAIADSVVRATGGRWEVGESTAGGASMAVSWSRGLSGPREPAAVPTVSPSAQ